MGKDISPIQAAATTKLATTTITTKEGVRFTRVDEVTVTVTDQSKVEQLPDDKSDSDEMLPVIFGVRRTTTTKKPVDVGASTEPVNSSEPIDDPVKKRVLLVAAPNQEPVVAETWQFQQYDDPKFHDSLVRPTEQGKSREPIVDRINKPNVLPVEAPYQVPVTGEPSQFPQYDPKSHNVNKPEKLVEPMELGSPEGVSPTDSSHERLISTTTTTSSTITEGTQFRKVDEVNITMMDQTEIEQLPDNKSGSDVLPKIVGVRRVTTVKRRTKANETVSIEELMQKEPEHLPTGPTEEFPETLNRMNSEAITTDKKPAIEAESKEPIEVVINVITEDLDSIDGGQQLTTLELASNEKSADTDVTETEITQTTTTSMTTTTAMIPIVAEEPPQTSEVLLQEEQEPPNEGSQKRVMIVSEEVLDRNMTLMMYKTTADKDKHNLQSVADVEKPEHANIDATLSLEEPLESENVITDQTLQSEGEEPKYASIDKALPPKEAEEELHSEGTLEVEEPQYMNIKELHLEELPENQQMFNVDPLQVSTTQELIPDKSTIGNGMVVQKTTTKVPSGVLVVTDGHSTLDVASEIGKRHLVDEYNRGTTETVTTSTIMTETIQKREPAISITTAESPTLDEDVIAEQVEVPQYKDPEFEDGRLPVTEIVEQVTIIGDEREARPLLDNTDHEVLPRVVSIKRTSTLTRSGVQSSQQLVPFTDGDTERSHLPVDEQSLTDHATSDQITRTSSPPTTTIIEHHTRTITTHNLQDASVSNAGEREESEDRLDAIPREPMEGILPVEPAERIPVEHTKATPTLPRVLSFTRSQTRSTSTTSQIFSVDTDSESVQLEPQPLPLTDEDTEHSSMSAEEQPPFDQPTSTATIIEHHTRTITTHSLQDTSVSEERNHVTDNAQQRPTITEEEELQPVERPRVVSYKRTSLKRGAYVELEIPYNPQDQETDIDEDEDLDVERTILTVYYVQQRQSKKMSETLPLNERRQYNENVSYNDPRELPVMEHRPYDVNVGYNDPKELDKRFDFGEQQRYDDVIYDIPEKLDVGTREPKIIRVSRTSTKKRTPANNALASEMVNDNNNKNSTDDFVDDPVFSRAWSNTDARSTCTEYVDEFGRPVSPSLVALYRERGDEMDGRNAIQRRSSLPEISSSFNRNVQAPASRGRPTELFVEYSMDTGTNPERMLHVKDWVNNMHIPDDGASTVGSRSSPQSSSGTSAGALCNTESHKQITTTTTTVEETHRRVQTMPTNINYYWKSRNKPREYYRRDQQLYDLYWKPKGNKENVQPSHSLSRYDIYWRSKQGATATEPSRRHSIGSLRDRVSQIPSPSHTEPVLTARKMQAGEGIFRPKNLFFRKNVNLARSFTSLYSYNSSDSADSYEDDLNDNELQNWLKESDITSPSQVDHVSRSHSVKVLNRTHGIQRMEPLKSRELISITPSRVAKWITALEIETRPIVTNYKQFKRAVPIPPGLTEEETFFVYCYFYRTKKWNVIARVDNNGCMVNIKVVRKRGSRNSEKSDVPLIEIKQRLAEIAEYGHERGKGPASRDKIPYTKIEHDDALLEDFRHQLQRKRSRNVPLIGKWFIILRTVYDKNINSFQRFLDNYQDLLRLSEHEFFVLYALVYGEQQWKVLLDANPRGNVYSVYCIHREFPEYLKEYDDVSDVEIRNILIKIAVSNPVTRKQLLKLGYKLPDPDPSLSQQTELPPNLQVWQSRLSTRPENRLSLREFEEAFPEVKRLIEEEKLLLYAYYHGDQEWEVMMQSMNGGRHVNAMSMTVNLPEPSDDLSFEYLDSNDDISPENFRELYHLWATPERIAGILTGWSVAPKEIVQSFQDFKAFYPQLSSATEFELFVIYALLYSSHKWKVVVEIHRQTNDVRLRLQLRHMHKDSKPFLYDFARPDYLEWLDYDKHPTTTALQRLLKEKGFTIPIGYRILSYKRVPSIPFTVSDWKEPLKHLDVPVDSLDDLQGKFVNLKEAPVHYQRLLYAYLCGLEQFELVLKSDSDQADSGGLYSAVNKIEKRKRPISRTTSTSWGSHHNNNQQSKFMNRADGHMKRYKKEIRLDHMVNTTSSEAVRLRPDAKRIRGQAHRKYSYLGDINEMMIEPSQISQYFSIVEEEHAQEQAQQQPLSYDQFRRKMSRRITQATEKELYALYCYYYGQALWKIVVQSQDLGALQDLSVVSHALNSPEIPHVDVTPLAIADWIQSLETSESIDAARSLQEFVSMNPGLNTLSQSEQYLLYCYFYGRCFWRVTVQPTTLGGNVISLRVSPTKRVKSLEIIPSPTSPDVWNSEASVWSFSPLPRRGASAWKFGPAPAEKKNIGKPLKADESEAWSFAPKTENPEVVEFVPSRRRLYRSQVTMGLPPAANHIDVYSQYGDTDHDAFDYVEPTQPTYTTKDARVVGNRQAYPLTETYVAQTSNADGLEFVPFDQTVMSHLSPKTRRKREQPGGDMSPVQYTKRRQTSVKMAHIKSHKENQKALMGKAEKYYKQNPDRSPVSPHRGSGEQTQVRNTNSHHDNRSKVLSYFQLPQPQTSL